MLVVVGLSDARHQSFIGELLCGFVNRPLVISQQLIKLKWVFEIELLELGARAKSSDGGHHGPTVVLLNRFE